MFAFQLDVGYLSCWSFAFPFADRSPESRAVLSAVGA